MNLSDIIASRKDQLRKLEIQVGILKSEIETLESAEKELSRLGKLDKVVEENRLKMIPQEKRKFSELLSDIMDNDGISVSYMAKYLHTTNVSIYNYLNDITIPQKKRKEEIQNCLSNISAKKLYPEQVSQSIENSKLAKKYGDNAFFN